ncbi:MAG TPA: ABC transporter permease [Nitrospirales bacterium]|jgi:phospholipid/cholesterol/gamma-HCH transport system permease protein|nr:ABC transporter permease [Nitrospirales bacterium]
MDIAAARIEDTVKGYVGTVQDFAQLCGTAITAVFRPPWYVRETIYYMDRIGVGSLFIVILTGIFTGMVLTLQGAIQLEPYGAVPYVSRLISTSVVRELGPVLAALMIAGRVGSGIASELASMQVTEQIDALRAEGTDPIKKLITTRLLACLIMVPVLTIITDGVAMFGGYLIARFSLSINAFFYWTWAFEALRPMDFVYGLIKPLVFGFIVCMVGCYAGLTTSGGTVGVGQSTTQAMVTSSILILMSDFFMTKLFIFIGF